MTMSDVYAVTVVREGWEEDAMGRAPDLLVVVTRKQPITHKAFNNTNTETHNHTKWSEKGGMPTYPL